MSGKPQKMKGIDIKNEIIKAENAGYIMKNLAFRLGVRSQTIQYYRRKFSMPLLKKWKYDSSCRIKGCDQKVHGLDLCNLHYKRMMNYGDPLKTIRRENGEGTLNQGYWRFKVNGVLKSRHILIAEKVLGKPLPKGVEVHHFDGDRSNDYGGSLIICQDRKYHKLLEKRYRELKDRRKNV